MQPGIWQIIIVVVWLLPMFPISNILKKAGYSPWWALIYVVPIGNLVALWIFAYTKWPAQPEGRLISN